MKNEIVIDSCWSDEVTSKLKNDFIYLVNTVFGEFVTEDYFNSKFIKNIYGRSLLTVAYVDGLPAGADAMWRNDVNGEEAYQSVDTCVLEQYRGIGLFKRLTNYEINLLGNSVLVYGFPNQQSYPGYVKMGWKVELFYKTLFVMNKKPLEESEEIGKEYVLWWLNAEKGLSVIRRNGRYYLIRKHKTKPVATIIGKVDEETAKEFPRTKGVLVLKYFCRSGSFYNRHRTIPMIIFEKDTVIPYWKIDAI